MVKNAPIDPAGHMSGDAWRARSEPKREGLGLRIEVTYSPLAHSLPA
jgi:hypothetical protein